MALKYLAMPLLAIDETLKAGYTKLGEKIPEKHLYKVTTALYFGSVFAGPLFNVPWAIAYASVVMTPDGVLNLMGLKDEKPTSINDGAQVIDPGAEFLVNITRGTRLPLIGAGVGLLAKSGYDIYQSITGHESLPEDFTDNVIAGLSFVSLASSMYLKDQDPKSLKKVSNAIEKIKDALTPDLGTPTPEPIPVKRNNFTLQERVENHFS